MIGELTKAEIESLLHGEVVARIGCHSGGRTYVVPITYVYDGTAIIGHSRDGMKIRLMRENPRVCIEVDRITDLATWQSVVAWGRYEELSGRDAADAVEQLVVRLAPLVGAAAAHGRMAPEHESSAYPREAATGMTVFRIRLDEKTGRFERRLAL